MPILQKRSLVTGSIPTTASLAVGELAMNIPDGKIYLRKSGSGSDTIQSAITTGAQNSGSVTLTGSLNLYGTGSVLNIAGDVFEISGDNIEFTGSFKITGSAVITGSLSVTNQFHIKGSGSLMVITGSILMDSGSIRLDDIGTDPAAPPADNLIFYAKKVGGRMLPKIIGPSGIDTVLQVGLHGNSVFMVAPANGTTAPTVWGGVLSTATTISHQQTIASANPFQATRRTRFQTTTTAGNASGMRTNYVQWYVGNAAGFGGFWFRTQLGMNINLNGGQKFVGLAASTAQLAGNPSALVNMCGMGYDSGDASTGNWFFMRNDGTGTATKVDLGTSAARNTTDGYDLIMFMAPNSSTLYVRIINLQSNVTVLDTSYTTDIPAVNTGMTFKAEVRNGAVNAADNIEIAKVYIETDY